MVLAKYQHMSILEFILIIKQHILILCKKATHVIKLGFALRFISTRAICLPKMKRYNELQFVLILVENGKDFHVFIVLG